MDRLIEFLQLPWKLIVSGDPSLWGMVATSFGVSLVALAVATPIAVGIALPLGLRPFVGRRLLIALLHSSLAVPPVMVGLTLYLVLSATGPLASLSMLYSHAAIVVGQCLLSIPIVAALVLSALQTADPRAWETARALGASPGAALLTLSREQRYPLVAALVTAFGRILGETGCAMIVGGNIAGHTRSLATAASLNLARGAMAEAMAVGLILVTGAFAVYGLLAAVHGKRTLLT